MSRFGMKKIRRKISNSVQTACKFRYIVTYEYLEVKSHDEWKPTELNILWFRGHRTKCSAKPTWSVQIPNQLTKTTTCTAKWNPPCSVELLVTLYKDISGSAFKKKGYMFVIEDICGPKRKKLGIFPCNLATYVSMDGKTSDLELEFKSLSKKVISTKCGLKIKCEFIKEGSSIDDDMQSNFSHMSEAEEFSRMSELAEVSDEEDYNETGGGDARFDDIPEVDEHLRTNWEEVNELAEENNVINEEVEPSSAITSMKSRAKPWSKFVADMNSFEWKQISMLRNPLSSSQKKTIANQLKEQAMAEELKDEQPVFMPSSVSDLANHEEKQIIHATSFEVDEQDENAVTEVDDQLDENGRNNSIGGKTKNGLKDCLKETIKNVTGKNSKLRSLGASVDEIKELEAKVQEKNATIWNVERENKELIVENNKLQDDVFSLQKQRDELQSEIGELQILVEDFKIRLNQSEDLQKQLQEEEKEILARMNLCGWLCKRGIKGLTGHIWRRRWFATDKSGRLYYYKQSNNSTPQGFIDLDKIITVEDQGGEKQDKNYASFNVSVGKRKYEFMAHDAEEKQKWINALDYLRHWRSHTARYSAMTTTLNRENQKPIDEEDALNPFL